MPRIFSPILIKDDQISITGEKARYLTSVLRCEKGDEITVLDGKGNCFKTKILRSDKREVIAAVLEKFTCNTESNINIYLAQGLLKGQKMDMVIQKVTELGVKEILPIITERSQPRETRKIARWRNIAEEASRQSGRSITPHVHEPMKFHDIFSLLPSPQTLKGLLFYEEGGMKISEAIHDFSKGGQRGITVFIAIGPEGGFSRTEVSFAEENGFVTTSLGKRILRAETAAISAVALVQYLLGDMG